MQVTVCEFFLSTEELMTIARRKLEDIAGVNCKIDQHPPGSFTVTLDEPIAVDGVNAANLIELLAKQPS